MHGSLPEHKRGKSLSKLVNFLKDILGGYIVIFHAQNLCFFLIVVFPLHFPQSEGPVLVDAIP